MKNIKILIVSLVIITVTISCTKKAEPTPSAPLGTLQFHLHTNVGSNEVDSLNWPYKDTTGRQIVVDTAQLYISNIQLIGNNNSIAYSDAGKVIFKIQSLEPYVIGQVPVGQYQSVKFNIGLDTATNATAPAANDTVFNQKSMFLNGGSSPVPGGYVFIYFSGYIDTTIGKTGQWNAAGPTNGFAKFSYKIGTVQNLASITMPSQPFTIVANSLQEVHMIIDYAMLFKNVDVTQKANLTINSSNQSSILTKQAVQNIQPNVLIRYEY